MDELKEEKRRRWRQVAGIEGQRRRCLDRGANHVAGQRALFSLGNARQLAMEREEKRTATVANRLLIGRESCASNPRARCAPATHIKRRLLFFLAFFFCNAYLARAVAQMATAVERNRNKKNLYKNSTECAGSQNPPSRALSR